MKLSVLPFGFKTLFTISLIILVFPQLNAQSYWSGNINTTDDLTRTGSVGIGLSPGALSYMLTVQGDFFLGDAGNYNNIVLSTGTAVSGYNGTFEIYPRSVPGSGMAKQLTYFKSPSHSNGSTRHDVALDGFLGLGTTQPIYPLHIKSNSTSTAMAANVALTLANYQYTVGTGVTLGFEFSNNVIGASITGKSLQSSGGGWLTFSTRNNYGVYKEQMVISSSGNVGIGVNPNNAKLEIQQTNNLEALRVDGASGAFAFVVKGGDINTTHLRSGLTIGQNYFITPPNNGVIIEGNVGIGTTTPDAYKLAVEGRIGARSIKVTSASWADYVFAPTYTLMPLSEVESFIQSKGHLPKIPSAEEIKENGFVMEEMDALLMSKIEELTLYIIAQEKKIKVLEETIKNQNE